MTTFTSRHEFCVALAKGLLRRGMDMGFIAEFTGLSVGELQGLVSQEKYHLIQEALQKNLDISLIMECTGLTEEALNDLRKGDS